MERRNKAGIALGKRVESASPQQGTNREPDARRSPPRTTPAARARPPPAPSSQGRRPDAPNKARVGWPSRKPGEGRCPRRRAWHGGKEGRTREGGRGSLDMSEVTPRGCDRKPASQPNVPSLPPSLPPTGVAAGPGTGGGCKRPQSPHSPLSGARWPWASARGSGGGDWGQGGRGKIEG